MASPVQIEVKPLPADAELVFTGKIYSVWHWQQELFDGRIVTFERLSRADYAFVVGVLPDQRIMLVEDEQPDRGVVLTPAGGGTQPNEAPQTAAERELLEETGYRAHTIVPWFSYRPSTHINMLAHGFIGRGCTLQETPEPESGERITVVTYTFDEFIELGRNPLLRDWQLRIELLEAKIDPAKRAALEKLLYG